MTWGELPIEFVFFFKGKSNTLLEHTDTKVIYRVL